MLNNSYYHQTFEQLNEELVIIEAAKKNPKDFELLYNKYYKNIFNYVFQRMDCKETAFDLTSQVFFKALNKISTYQDRGVPFGSWLYRIAQNELMLLFRSQKNKRTVNADIGDLHFICEEPGADVFFEEYIPVIKKLIAELHEDDLQFVEMRYFEKRPFKEIAEILNISEVNAKVKMHRIIEKLKKKIQKYKI
ncbi:MAG: sigma-70 family RNA polymerase sigma factor [Bacteroidetes bacterium]|nr:sigma-70 family RNA polymerase sigma factor [Bacteroidota bacterium]